MALADSLNRYRSFLDSLGKGGLNSLFPNDFEAYVIAFELVDSVDNTIEFFSFPIMPSNISISEPEITNIKKTARGVTSLKTDSFIPRDINLTGNFGRNLKIIIRNKIFDFESFKSVLGLTKSEFNGPNVKTGYGTMKVFKRILDGSKTIDSKGNPVKLYFYNFTFGDNYLVEVVDKSFTMARDSSNMIWNYNVNLKAVAPITNSFVKKQSLLGIIAASSIQKTINDLSSDVQRYMSGQQKSKFKAVIQR